MSIEYDERVKDYWKLSDGKNFVKLVEDDCLEEKVKKLNTISAFGCFRTIEQEKNYEQSHPRH